jgi:hypothetical protein
MTYQTPDGRTFVLAHHTQEEWANVVLTRLRALGCHEGYAARFAVSIYEAKPVSA